MLTQKELKKVLRYDAATGHFFWKKGRNKGSFAGTYDRRAHNIIGIEGKIYKAHDLAFLYIDGNFPDSEGEVVHMDGYPCNNKWSNLRLYKKEEIRGVRFE